MKQKSKWNQRDKWLLQRRFNVLFFKYELSLRTHKNLYEKDAKPNELINDWRINQKN